MHSNATTFARHCSFGCRVAYVHHWGRAVHCALCVWPGECAMVAMLGGYAPIFVHRICHLSVP